VGQVLFIVVLILEFFFAHPVSAATVDEWEKTLAKARQEGRVVLGTNLGVPGFRQAVTSLFQKRFGFGIELRVLGSAELTAVVGRECAAGRPSMDVLLSGNAELIGIHPKGCLAPLKPRLILSEVSNSENWRGGILKFNDPERQYLFQTGEEVYGWILINSEQIKPEEIISAQDLLKPQYRGKIASFDPRQGGAAQNAAAYLLTVFGEDFIRRLFADQKVVITSDHRQLAEWIARGVYPIGFGAVERAIEPLRRENLPIATVTFRDAPGYLSGSSSIVKLIKDGPQPNAATVLANWLGTKEWQEIFSREVSLPSRRTDVRVEGIPDYLVPKPGGKYLDSFDHEYYVKKRPEVVKVLVNILGR
jgi:ABC-type Fe3+ transport system substrate-binding protein